MVAPITPQNVQSPQSVTRKRRLADAMMQQGTDTSPVGHPLGALARALQGGMAGYMSGKADRAEQEGLAGVMAKMQSGDNRGAMIDQWATPGMSRLAEIELQRQAPEGPPEPKWHNFQSPTGDLMRYDQNAQTPQPQMVYDAPDQPAGPPAPEVNLDDAKKMLDIQEGSAGFKRFNEIAPTLQSMHKSLSDPSAMADLDFVYGVAKILDPTSVVRESEVGLVVEGQSLPSQIQGRLNQLLNGGQKLDTRVRGELYKIAHRRGAELAAQAQQEYDHYSGIAGQTGVPSNVLQQVPGLAPEIRKWEDQNMQAGGQQSAPQGAITPADLEFTAQKYGISVDEVKRRLGIQ
jgi:hypothetical protein